MSLFLAKKLDSVLTTLQLNFLRNYISTTLAKIWDTFSGTASDGFPKSKFVTFYTPQIEIIPVWFVWCY